MNNSEIEDKVKVKGLNKGPRVTEARIKSLVTKVQYYVFPGTTLTVCAVTLKNGFTVTGESAAASIKNFDVDLGKQIAYDKALDKVWALEGYLLKETEYQSAEFRRVEQMFNEIFTGGFRL